jgi:hypothetical protein
VTRLRYESVTFQIQKGQAWKRKAYRVIIGKPAGNKALSRPRSRWLLICKFRREDGGLALDSYGSEQ